MSEEAEPKDPEMEKLRNVSAKIGEHFADFLLVVRINDGFMFKHSDKVWGLGAAEIYSAAIKDQGLINRIEQMERDED
jgi:hypothetical protein